ncbi:MAG: hypothetical protein LBU85_12585 [Treponema sp.]|jgi:hypothetical protein|nr:hypothetical protein [Treponema sp.]
MKKTSAIFVLLFISLSLWAQENEPKERRAIKNRVFELSLANFDIGLSNTFLKAGDVIRDPAGMKQSGKFFKDSVSINMNDFFEGFTFNFGAVIKPLSINFNWKDKWGFGLDIGHTSVTGGALLPENVLSLKESSDEKIEMGAAVFTDVGIPVFFHLNKLKIKVRPSAFLPVVYTEPDITYSNTGTRIQAAYDIRIYSIVDMQGLEDNNFGAVGQGLLDNVWGIAKNNLGYDVSLGLEYPFFKWLDVGVDIVNIPLVTSNLTNYMQIEGEAYFDSGKIDFMDLANGGAFPEDAYDYPKDFEIKYNNDGSIKIYRPFTTLFYAKCRPFGSPVFSLIPSIGFSLNRLYTQFASIEGGLSARLDLANVFITSIGVNYNDRRWKNSVDFILNLRAFELDFGVSFQSPDFIKSFQGAGLGVNAGLKIGW